MTELDERLEALCKTAALLILRNPDRGEEIEDEIADVFRVQRSTVHELIEYQVGRLGTLEKRAPFQHA